jgi:MFS family permease
MGASRLATLVGNLGLPFLAERIGHRRMIGVGTVLHAAAALTASLAPSGAWFIGVFFLSGLGGAAGGVSGMPFMMQVSPRGRRVGYTTFSMVALMPLGMLAAIGAGLFMTAMHTLLFFVAALLILAALLPLEHCRPPSE